VAVAPAVKDVGDAVSYLRALEDCLQENQRINEDDGTDELFYKPRSSKLGTSRKFSQECNLKFLSLLGRCVQAKSC
jgi:hypothetical protein